jgi:hypothetical protein
MILDATKTLVLLLPLLAATAPTNALAPDRGSLVSGGWTIRWTPKGATATQTAGSKTVVLYENHTSTSTSPGAFETPATSSTLCYMMSVVDTVVSYRCSRTGEGGMHPTAYYSISAVDLAHGGAPADIRSLFDEPSLIRWLLEDRYVSSQYPRDIGVPATLDELVENLKSYCIANFNGLPTSFAVVAAGPSTAVVTFGLPHATETCRGQYTQITLLLPIPARRQSVFDAAVKKGSLLVQFQHLPPAP